MKKETLIAQSMYNKSLTVSLRHRMYLYYIVLTTPQTYSHVGYSLLLILLYMIKSGCVKEILLNNQFHILFDFNMGTQ